MASTYTEDTGWSRRRLAATAGAIVVCALLVVAGAALAVIRVAAPPSQAGEAGSRLPSMATPDEIDARLRRTEIAAAPMQSVAASAAQPLAAGSSMSEVGRPHPVVLPSSTATGPAGVVTGFPGTDGGAVAQLAAISESVLQSMSSQTVADVYSAWSSPPGEPVGEWELSRTAAAFREAAGITGTIPPDLLVEADPTAALVKGTDGPDWVLACVLMRVHATYRATGEVAYGYCAAMRWAGNRWMLDTSQDTAPAPSTWPGTPMAAEAGWHPIAPDGRGGVSAGPSPSSTSTPSPAPASMPQWFAPAAGDATARLDIDLPNPLTELGGVVAGAAADAWTSAMLAVWSAGLMVLRIVLTYADLFLTPDLRADGPGHDAYVYTFWIASVLVLLMLLVQLGASVVKREASGLARAAVGAAQFVLVWSCWLGYCVIVVAACGSLSHALMGSLLGASSWDAWDPVAGFETADVTDSTVATVLGLLGCVLWLAAIGHLLVMLARAASLIVLVATGPIAAAGLVAHAGKSWFWKSLRWFHAAALTPVLMVLVLGIGAQVTTGVATGLTDNTQQAVGTALPAVLLLCVACVAPMALFKLLAFVDPGTSSGASFRQGMAAQGGLQGLLPGGSGGGQGDPGASATDQHGRAEAESGAESATSDRFTGSTQSALGRFGGGVGQALSTGMSSVQKVGGLGAALLADESNQAGVGHRTHGPDFSSLTKPKSGAGGSGDPAAGEQTRPSDANGGLDDLHPPMPPAPTIPSAPVIPPGTGSSGAGPGATSGASSGASGGAAASAAAVPPVPV